MPVTFGWSASDIGKAIEILATVYNSLKDVDGAASEYQDLADFLTRLTLTLQHLQNLDTRNSDVNFLKAIRAQGAAVLRPVSEFMSEISRYEPALSRHSGVSRFTSAYSKVGWGLRMPERLAKLKTAIGTELEVIHLLVESEGLKQHDLNTSRILALHNDIHLQSREQTKFNAALMNALADLSVTVERHITQCPIPDHNPSMLSPPHADRIEGDFRSLQAPGFTNGKLEWSVQARNTLAFLVHNVISQTSTSARNLETAIWNDCRSAEKNIKKNHEIIGCCAAYLAVACVFMTNTNEKAAVESSSYTTEPPLEVSHIRIGIRISVISISGVLSQIMVQEDQRRSRRPILPTRAPERRKSWLLSRHSLSVWRYLRAICPEPIIHLLIEGGNSGLGQVLGSTIFFGGVLAIIASI